MSEVTKSAATGPALDRPALSGLLGKVARSALVRGAAVCVVALLIPLGVTDPFWQLVLGQAGIYALVAIGLNLLTGYVGQVSIAQGGLMAIGAYTCGILTVTDHWGFWPGAAAAVGVSVLVGGLMSLSALRLSAWYFAVITLILAVVVQQLLVQMSWLTGGAAGLVGVLPPSLGGHILLNQQMLWLVIAFDVLAFALVNGLIKSRFGRSFIALRDNPAAASASGIAIWRARLVIFMLSSGLAGLGGALFAAQKSVITPDDFGISLSTFLLLAVVLGGSGTLWGPVVGCAVLFIVPDLLSSLSDWQSLVYGALLLVLVLVAPRGIVGELDRSWSAWRHRGASAAMATAQAPSELSSRPAWSLPSAQGALLQVSRLHMAFGGVTALDGVSLTVEAGAVHAIVGPNGSGKTTLLNAICGFYRPSGGEMALDGLELAGRPVSSIAAMGIGRTFQTPRLLPDLDAVENVMLGAYRAEHCSAVAAVFHLKKARRQVRGLREHALRLIELVGLENATQAAGAMPHGQQRLLEIARALMGGPRVLLLDEPAAGLSLSELDSLADLVQHIHASGTTVVVVEHHLDLIGRIADTVTVLERGRILKSGSPAEVFADAAVQLAYMGKSGRAEESHGPRT